MKNNITRKQKDKQYEIGNDKQVHVNNEKYNFLFNLFTDKF